MLPTTPITGELLPAAELLLSDNFSLNKDSNRDRQTDARQNIRTRGSDIFTDLILHDLAISLNYVYYFNQAPDMQLPTAAVAAGPGDCNK